MNTLIKTLLISAAVALAYPAIAAGPASAPRFNQQEMTKEQHMKYAEDRFNALDANKDGKITSEERAANRKGRGMGPGAGMPVEMTREQHMKYAQERFDAMDTNKDGKISVEERQAKRQGKQGMMRGGRGSGQDGRGYGPGPRGGWAPQASTPAPK